MDKSSHVIVVSNETMREIDRVTISEIGIPGLVLMEHAGKSVAERAWILTGSRQKKKFVIVCGKGNNAGDGFVAARWLNHLGGDVTVCILSSKDQYRGDSLVNFHILKALHISVTNWPNQDSQEMFKESHLIIDAIFGTGFRGDLDSFFQNIINTMNQSGIPILSVDIPSGLCVKNKQICTPCIQAKETITFGLAKNHLLEVPAVPYVGNLIVADIGFPSQVVRRVIERDEKKSKHE